MEDQIFKPQSNKKWTPNKKYYTIKTYTEVTGRQLNQQGGISDNKEYNNLSIGDRIALQN